MKPAAFALACLVLVGCTPRLVRESVERVSLPEGLEIHWAGPPRQTSGPLFLHLRCIGDGPVVLLRLARTDGVEPQGETPDSSQGKGFVRRPEPGEFRYDGDNDRLLAEKGGGTPFSVAEAFLWYDLVLYPAAEATSIELGRAEPGSTVHVLVEYIPVSYQRLARAGYVAPDDEQAEGGASESAEVGAAVVRFGRLSEREHRRRRPRELFLRTDFLPPAITVPLEIPWGPPP